MRTRIVSVCISSAVLIGASPSAAAQSFGEIVGRIGGVFFGIGMAYTLEV